MSHRTLCRSEETANVVRYCIVIVPLILLFTEAQAQTGAWTRKRDMPTGRAIISAAVVNDKIYVVGGMGAPPVGAALAANEVYDPSTDTWKKLKDRPTARCFASSAAVDGILYAIGGIRFGAGGDFSGSDTTSAVDAYDPATDTWTPKGNLFSPRFGASACVVDGIIYNIGGNHAQSACEAYDPKTSVWTRKSNIPGTEGGIIATGYTGRIYAFGGGYSTSFSTVCAYDPKTDSWTRKKDMPTPRATSQVCVVGGKIYVLGGYKSIRGEVVSAIEVYDPVTDTWTKKPGMPFNRTMFGAAVVNGKIYVIGGTCDWTGANGSEVWEYDPAFHTDIPAGYVSGRWTLSQSPYHVNGEITIPNGSTLIIEPGVEVVFMGHYKLNVQGRLLAVGTQKDSIRFTAADTLAGWHGIRFVGTPQSNDTSRIAYCVFTYGKANTGDWGGLDRAGGAILISGFDKVVVSECRFTANMNWGEMWETGGAAVFIKQASPTVTKSTFQGNTGSSDFAIKCVYASKAIIAHNVISHSTGEWDAIVCEHSAENRPLITGNIISHNVSRQGGGGIGFYRTSNARVENNVIVHNSGVGGGIVCSVAGSPTIINNTIAFNSASKGGGGIVCRRGSNPILINNILYGNSAPVGWGPQVALDDDAADPVILCCNVQGGKEGFGGSGAGSYYTGPYVNNIDVDPKFVNTATGDYRLSDSSPCIGAGADSIGLQGVWYHAPRACFGGNPRPSPAGSMPDMGAYESPLGSLAGAPAYAHYGRLSRHGRDTVGITARVFNPLAHPVNVVAILTSGSGLPIDSLHLKDDGLHGDSAEADGLWGYMYVPKKDDTIRVTIRTDDLTAGTFRIFADIKEMIFTRNKAMITVDTRDVDFGQIKDVVPRRDTTFLVRNTGYAADSLATMLDPGNVIPDSAVSVSPLTFVLAAGDSQKMTFSIRPKLLGLAYYFAVITVQSTTGYGQTTFTKNFLFQKIATSVSDQTGIPTEFALEQNFPNPFNSTTTINYSLPSPSHNQAEGRVGLPAGQAGVGYTTTIKVCDLLGREVAILVNDKKEPGSYQVTFDATRLASGVYLYRMSAGGFTDTKKLLLLR